MGRLSADAFQHAPKIGLRVALDNVRSGNNVGSVFRTADAFRLREVLLGGITAQPPHRDIQKTALGAEQHVNWRHFMELQGELLALKKAGVKIACVEQVTNSTPLQNWQPAEGEEWCVVVGNEVSGVDDALVHLADVCLEIPQFGSKHSLNVSVCTGMVMWQYMQACGLKLLTAQGSSLVE